MKSKEKKFFKKFLSLFLATAVVLTSAAFSASVLAEQFSVLPEEFSNSSATWHFASSQEEVEQRLHTDLGTTSISVELLDENDTVQSATIQWFARISGNAHVTGVPIPHDPIIVNLDEARGNDGFVAKLILEDEFGIIPLVPGNGSNNAAVLTGVYNTETWQYFAVVTYVHEEGLGRISSAPSASLNPSESNVFNPIFVRFEGTREEIANRPPRDYFPSVHHDDFINQFPLEEFLNDPFIFFEYHMNENPIFGTNGHVVTEDDWWQRNAEIRDLVGYYWFGMLPYIPIENIEVTTAALNINDTTTATTQIQVIIRSNGRVVTGNVGTITMPSRLQIENSAFNLEDGIPVIFGGPAGTYNPQGIATFAAGGIAHTALHPANNNITEFNQGSIINNAWQVSRALDALEILFERNGIGANPNKSATIGVSIGGKQAMFRGVMDERVALTVPVESGAFGMTHMRNLVEGFIPSYEGHTYALPWVRAQKPMNSWGFSGEAGWFAFGVGATGSPFGFRVDPNYSTYRIPFDMHLVASLAAPRALLAFDNDGAGSGNGWMNPFGQQLVIDATREVYGFLGDQRGVDLTGNIGGRVRDNAHAVQGRDHPFVVATLISMFGNESNVGFGRETGAVEEIVVQSIGTTINPPAYGFGTYANLKDLSINPLEVQSRFIQWSRPGTYSIWTDTEFVSDGLDFTINAFTNAPNATEIELLLWSSGNANPLLDAPVLLESHVATVQSGVATFNITGNVGRYELRFLNQELPLRSSVFFTGIDHISAMRTGASPGISHMFRSFGFTSRINTERVAIYVTNAAGEEFYLPSEPIEELARVPQGWGGNVTAATGAWGGWIMEYGIAIPNQGAPGSANNRLFSNGGVIMRNVELEAMPGFTFQVGFASGATNGNPAHTGVLWPTTEAVQSSQLFPHWPPVGGLSGSGGESGAFGARPDGTRAFRQPVATNFDTNIEFSLNGLVVAEEVGALEITFSQPMNVRDFGIGFDFSNDFDLIWSENNTVVTVTFNTDTTEKIGLANLYIIRLRDMAGNSINQPIHHQFEIDTHISEIESILSYIEYLNLDSQEFTVATWSRFIEALEALLQYLEFGYNDVTRQELLASLETALRNLMPRPVATPSASVTQLNGNSNDLHVTITELLYSGEEVVTTQIFRVRNNASDTFEIVTQFATYHVFVNTQGNTQIREIFIVE